MPELLSSSLYTEVRDPAFFRVLAGRNAPTYVDVLDALDRECTERPDGLERNEAVEIIAEILSKHPEFQPEIEEEAETLRRKAKNTMNDAKARVANAIHG